MSLINPTLTLRENVSSPLTWAQLDGNFTNIVAAVNANAAGLGAGGASNLIVNALTGTNPGTLTYDTASSNYTLPLAASVPAGTGFALTCQNSTSSGLAVSGSDTMILNAPNNAAFNSSSADYPFRLHSGDMMGAVSDGVSKWIVTGTPQMQFASSGASWSPPVGSVRRGAMTVSAAAATATYTAAELVLGSPTPASFNNFHLAGPSFKAAGLSLSVNLGTTGAGGMDTGSAPTSGFVGLYVIFNPAIAASGGSDIGYALLAVNATSSNLADVYGGANMPSGYVYSALVSVWPTNGSGQFVVGHQGDRAISVAAVQVLSATADAASFTSFSLSAAAPMNAVSASGTLGMSDTTVAQQDIFVASDANGVGAVELNAYSQPGAGPSVPFSLDIETAQTLYYKAGGGSGTLTFTVSVSRYVF
jgi:hypothetical protein